MPVLVTETFEVYTPESLDHGAPEEVGYIDPEGTEYDFRELVELLECTEPSTSNLTDYSRHIWFNGPVIQNRAYFEQGREESRSYHPQDDRAARYMVKAWRWSNERRKA